MEEILKVEDLSIIYKTDLETVYAVNGISFSLKQGETMGLVGETGAGKTTTAMGIMGLLPKRTARITSGQILFENHNVCTLKEREMERIRGQKISMIFQDPMTALNPVLTVGDQIGEALYLHNEEGLSQKEIDKKTEETLELVGIPKERKNDYPYQFSGGMRQRVVIAIALVCNPKLLIADEPTTALDVTIQAQILSMICDLQRKYGTSVIMIRSANTAIPMISTSRISPRTAALFLRKRRQNSESWACFFLLFMMLSSILVFRLNSRINKRIQNIYK